MPTGKYIQQMRRRAGHKVGGVEGEISLDRRLAIIWNTVSVTKFTTITLFPFQGSLWSILLEFGGTAGGLLFRGQCLAYTLLYQHRKHGRTLVIA